MSTAAARTLTAAASSKRLQSNPPRHERFLSHRAVHDVPAPVSELLRESGRPLDESIRVTMERRFGHDFSSVRIHTDGNAAHAARSVGAAAFTVGRHVAFGSGQYDASSSRGLGTLVHELTHVVQQSAPANTTSLDANCADDSAAEASAARNARTFVSGDGAMDLSNNISHPVVQRLATNDAADLEKGETTEKDDAWRIFFEHVEHQLEDKYAALESIARNRAKHVVPALFSRYEKKIKPDESTRLGQAIDGAGKLIPEVSDFSEFIEKVLKIGSLATMKEQANKIVSDRLLTLGVSKGSFARFAYAAVKELLRDFPVQSGQNADIENQATKAAKDTDTRFGPESVLGKAFIADFAADLGNALAPIRKQLDRALAIYWTRKIGKIGLGVGALGGGVLGALGGPDAGNAFGEKGKAGGIEGAKYGAALAGVGIGSALVLGTFAYQSIANWTRRKLEAHREKNKK